MANQSVKLIECPRDAWQGLPRQIPTEMKVQYLGALIGAAFKNIDAVSFVSPKAVPQMADGEQVLEQRDDARIPLLDFAHVSAAKPEPITRRKFRDTEHNQAARR